MPPDEQRGVQPAQPTVAVGGSDDDSLTNGLLELRIAERYDGLYACEATFGNWGPVGAGTGFLYFDRKKLDFGTELSVKLAQDVLFKGRVTGLRSRFAEGAPPGIVVLAEDRLQDLRMTRRTRTFADASDADVFQRIASDHSLTPDVGVHGPTHKVLAQLGQSDLAFLRDRARAIGAELWVDDKTLSAKPRTDRGGAKVELSYGHELREIDVSADLAGQATDVEVSGWDVAGKAPLRESAGADVLGSELDGDASAGSILQQAFGARKETVPHTVPITSAEARARVEAAFRRQARRFVSGRGVAQTDARLRVGAKVTLKGLGDLFTGDYYVTESIHLFDRAHGQRTEIAVERAGIGSAR